MTPEEKELIENILTAEVLILAKVKAILDKISRTVGSSESSYEADAVVEIKNSKANLIQQLLS